MKNLTLLPSAIVPMMIAILAGCGAGNSTSEPGATKLLATSAAAATINYTLAADGSGNFRTLKEAFAAIPDNNTTRTIITIKPGTYVGQAILTRYKHMVTLQGSDAATTILSYYANVNEQPAGTDDFYKGYGVVIESNDFKADRVTFQNTSGDHGQAIALRINGDRAVVTNSRLLGWQDTLNINNGRHYFKDTYIEGRVDFIYGSATAIFDHCEIKSKNGGYITAASTPVEKPYGFVFMYSRLTNDAKPWDDPNVAGTPATPSPATQAFLGRPWRPYAAVTYLNTVMNSHIKAEGWNNWGNVANESTARYAEYGSTGTGGKPAGRVTWAKQLTAAQASAITIKSVLGGSDNWVPL